MANIINKFRTNNPKKPIELVKLISTKSGEMKIPHNTILDYNNIELIKPNGYGQGYDVIKCWKKDEYDSVIYLGHWNDGVI